MKASKSVPINFGRRATKSLLKAQQIQIRCLLTTGPRTSSPKRTSSQTHTHTHYCLMHRVYDARKRNWIPGRCVRMQGAISNTFIEWWRAAMMVLGNRSWFLLPVLLNTRTGRDRHCCIRPHCALKTFNGWLNMNNRKSLRICSRSALKSEQHSPITDLCPSTASFFSFVRKCR